MASPEDGVPEPVEAPRDGFDGGGTGEISMLPPAEAREVMEEIRAVAESRGDDSQVHDLLDIPPTGPIPVGRSWVRTSG